MKLINKIDEISWHRNGVCGVGFYAILFHADIDASDAAWSIKGVGSPARKNARFLAVLYDQPGCCSVICLDLIDSCGVRFAEGNSWRGDHYESELREAVENYNTGRVGPFSCVTQVTSGV